MISKEEILVALIKSGYLLEDRVNKALTTNGWLTVPNMRYIDDQTGALTVTESFVPLVFEFLWTGNDLNFTVHMPNEIPCYYHMVTGWEGNPVFFSLNEPTPYFEMPTLVYGVKFYKI